MSAFQTYRGALIVSYFNAVSHHQRQRSIEAQATRLQDLGSSLDRIVDCEHQVSSVAEQLWKVYQEGWDLILFSGACAVVDEEDVLPAAIRKIGGVVRHIGMPVEPGNMLVWGEINKIPIIGIPGCARSSKKSGIEWVLERIFCSIPFEPADIMRMGAGGLLSSPRRKRSEKEDKVRIGAIVLMAGLSSRMPHQNKLLIEMKGEAIAVRTVKNLSEAGFSPIVVVTGHEEEKIKQSLANQKVFFIHNESYREGMGTSIQRAMQGIWGWDGALIAMGDMPFVSTKTCRRLREEFEGNPDSIVAPSREGTRGQPVLFSSRFFPELQKCAGDMGARQIIENNQAALSLVEVEHEGVFWDIDSPSDIEKVQQELGDG